MSVLAFRREPTFNFFHHTKLAKFSPRPFSLNGASITRAADIAEVMRLDMFIELFAKLFNSFATRDAGKWFPATRPIRAPRKATQPGGVFDKCFCKL